MTWPCFYKSLLRILVFLLLVPFLTVFFTCIWIYRGFISIIHNIRIGIQGGHILGVQSSMYYCKHENDPIMAQVHFKFNGAIDFNAFRDRIQTRMVEAKNSNSSQLIYPELSQYIHLFLGYYFWRVDEFFDIKSHVICYEDSNHESAIQKDEKFCEKLALQVNEEFLPDKKSPWLILVANDVLINEHTDEKGTFIIFRFAHYLGDGYSIFQLISKLADESKLEIYQPKLPNKCETCVQYLCSPFSKIIQSAKKSTNNSEKFWSKFSTKGQLELGKPLLRRQYILSHQIPTTNIRQAATALKVSFSSVLFCTFQKGIQSYFTKYDAEIPDRWATMFPIPAPTRATGLVNDVYFILEDMPTSKDRPFQDQIKNYHQRLIELKSSTASLTNTILLFLVGLLPIQWRGLNTRFKFLMPKRKYFSDIYFVTFPGPKSEMHMLGKSIIEMSYFVKTRTNSCLAFATFIFNGQMQFWLGTLTELLTSGQTTELMEFIEKEFKNLSLLNGAS